MHFSSPSEVLAAAGFCLEDCPEARHVVLEGLDIEPDSSMFGGSITIEKATDPRGERCTSAFIYLSTTVTNWVYPCKLRRSVLYL